MKSVFSKLVLLLALTTFIATGCNQQAKKSKGTTSDGKEASVEVEQFDAVKMKDQIVEIIQNMPKTSEVAEMLNKAGASYIIDLTVPAEDAERLMTTNQLSLGLGMFAFDFEYANVYNRTDKVAEIGEIEKGIIRELGLEAELTSSEGYVERIKENADNADSVNYLVTAAMNHVHQKFAASDRPDVYALAVIGGNVEALYVLTQLTLFANDNTEFLNILTNQKERVKTVFSLLELMSGDETVKPYYDELKPVAEIFKTNETMGEEQLKEMVPLIEKARNTMLQK
ncbi:MAG: hypothetical protein K9H26_08150 [Prolixibacteraceae bacterium]|nr:hypothetical protein [Prolixibacteraceae bacterium]